MLLLCTRRLMELRFTSPECKGSYNLYICSEYLNYITCVIGLQDLVLSTRLTARYVDTCIDQCIIYTYVQCNLLYLANVVRLFSFVYCFLQQKTFLLHTNMQYIDISHQTYCICSSECYTILIYCYIPELYVDECVPSYVYNFPYRWLVVVNIKQGWNPLEF